MPRIDSVRIKDVDSSLSTKGGRTLEVRCGSRTFSTPTRPLSTMDISAKSYLGYRGELKSDIAALAIDFSGGRKEYFLKRNGVLARSEKRLQSLSDASYGLPSMPIIQIDPFLSTERAYFKLAFEFERSIESIDVLSMPGVIGNGREFESMVTDWCSSSEDVGLGSAIQLSLAENVDSFSERLDILAELSKTGSFQVLNIQYAPIHKCRQQLAILWAKREDICAIINCIGVTSPPSHGNVGLVPDEETFLLQNGFDMITKKVHSVSPKYIGYLSMQPGIQSLDQVDDFRIARHSAATSIRKSLWNSMSHPPECECSVCKGQTREELIERFAYLDNGDISKSGLRYYSVLHDHQSDMQELEVFRKYTSSDGAKEYDQRIEECLLELKSVI